MRLKALALSLLVASSATLLLSGCSGKPENSPAIRKKFAEVDTMKDSLDQISAQLAMVHDDVTRISEENSDIRALTNVDGTGALEKLATLEKRLSMIEANKADQVMAMASKPAAAAGEQVASAETAKPTAADVLAGAHSAAPAAAPKPAEAAKPVASKPAAAPSHSDSFKQNTQAPADAAPVKKVAAQQQVSRGSYHTIEVGDTLDTIATKYNTTKDAILKANRLPAGVRLARGQRLFVPGS